MHTCLKALRNLQHPSGWWSENPDKDPFTPRPWCHHTCLRLFHPEQCWPCHPTYVPSVHVISRHLVCKCHKPNLARNVHTCTCFCMVMSWDYQPLIQSKGWNVFCFVSFCKNLESVTRTWTWTQTCTNCSFSFSGWICSKHKEKRHTHILWFRKFQESGNWFGELRKFCPACCAARVCMRHWHPYGSPNETSRSYQLATTSWRVSANRYDTSHLGRDWHSKLDLEEIPPSACVPVRGCLPGCNPPEIWLAINTF